jgi:hypothetical protein
MRVCLRCQFWLLSAGSRVPLAQQDNNAVDGRRELNPTKKLTQTVIENQPAARSIAGGKQSFRFGGIACAER